VGRFLRLVLVFYFLEAGAFLLIAPMSRFWFDRVVLRSPTPLHVLLMSPYFRGFLMGIGLLHVIFAAKELESWRRDLTREPAA
jgi:hypothetical protein